MNTNLEHVFHFRNTIITFDRTRVLNMFHRKTITIISRGQKHPMINL
ncbi:MAG: hypothetical protein BAJATHORv1_20437 [Candidatus Thorarchaeota archaeon]|nr:MAG: hypothetical protein BAJATHORv1_20437 [Candidatus Thorarchaeota archaeon]